MYVKKITSNKKMHIKEYWFPFFCLTVYIAPKSKIESRAHYAPEPVA